MYCFPKFFLGEAIANSLPAGAPPLCKPIAAINNVIASLDKIDRVYVYPKLLVSDGYTTGPQTKEIVYELKDRLR